MSHAHVTVFLAEDDEMLLDVAGALVESAGHTVVRARDGLVALGQLRAHVADAAHAGAVRVAVLDVRMPRMSGVEVIERMRADPALQDVPVIVTGGDDIAVPEADFELSKPYAPAELLALIEQAAAGRRRG